MCPLKQCEAEIVETGVLVLCTVSVQFVSDLQQEIRREKLGCCEVKTSSLEEPEIIPRNQWSGRETLKSNNRKSYPTDQRVFVPS